MCNVFYHQRRFISVCILNNKSYHYYSLACGTEKVKKQEIMTENTCNALRYAYPMTDE